MEKLTTSDFIKKSEKKHNSKYDYSKVEYKNNSTKVCIICPEHGEFWQRPNDHLRGAGCPLCGGVKKHTKETFIEKARLVHGDKYDYSKVEYKNNKTKVCIICPEHGEFWQKPESHTNQKQGCPKCSTTLKLTTKDFIEKSRAIHGDKYDYSKVEYVNNHTKVCIICPEHGEFWQMPSSHLSGNGCLLCAKKACSIKNRLTKEEFIKKAQEIHGNKYDYSKVNYINSYTKICIICPEHGEFWQIPNYHLNGNGCPLCGIEKNISENNLYCYLCENFQTPIIRQKTFKWLKNNKNLKIDFYLPEFNIGIEYQGEQHFYPIKYFGGVNKFNQQIENDRIKKKLCEEHKIKLLYFSYNKKFSNEVITDINELKNIITNAK